MRRSRGSRVSRVLVFATPAAFVLAAIGCSLGLDPSLINAQNDSGPPVVKDSGEDAPDSGPARADAGDASTVQVPDGGCLTDNDCKSLASTCVTSETCDPNQHVCVVGICQQPGEAGLCQSAECNSTGACTVPVSFGFHATSFTVTDGTTGCGGNFPGCFAVVWPFAFVGTQSGISVYQVSDPANGEPPSVTLDGVTFVPTRIVSVNRRVYFIGSPSGSGSSVRLPVAWLDVPGVPALTTLTASSSLITSSPTNLSGVFPTVGSALFITDVTQAVAPTEILAAPVDNTTVISTSDSPGIPSNPNQTVVAASGTRLVTYGYNGANAFAQFDFVDFAGTSNAQAEPAQEVSAMGQTCPDNTFAEGPNGSLLWMTAAGSAPDGGPDVVTSARLAWILAGETNDAGAATFSATEKVDVETYPTQPGFCTAVAGPMAWLDTNTALVVAANPSTLSQSVVQVASRAASPPVVLPVSHTISASVGQITAAGSNGYGYVLAQDLPATSDATLHIFAPSCM